jgi:hypothetical protein
MLPAVRGEALSEKVGVGHALYSGLPRDPRRGVLARHVKHRLRIQTVGTCES